MSPSKITESSRFPVSIWTSSIHPLHEQIVQEVDGYFLQHWPFPDEKARKKFVAAGFSRVTCFYFPKALDDRIHFACRLLTLLFLIDGEMRFVDGVPPLPPLPPQIALDAETCNSN